MQNAECKMQNDNGIGRNILQISNPSTQGIPLFCILHFAFPRTSPPGKKKGGPYRAALWENFYFFICAFTMASTSSGVSMGLAISFLGHTAAHRPHSVQME